MAEQEGFVQEGVDRLNEAFQSIDGEFQRVQKQMARRRRSLETQLTSQRKKVEKRTRKQLNRFQSELKKSPVYKRAESFRKDAVKQIESGVDSFLGLLQIASKADLDRIDRKLSTIGRRLKEIEKTGAPKTNGSEASAPH
jgi:hypothetical protein